MSQIDAQAMRVIVASSSSNGRGESFINLAAEGSRSWRDRRLTTVALRTFLQNLGAAAVTTGLFDLRDLVVKLPMMGVQQENQRSECDMKPG